MVNGKPVVKKSNPVHVDPGCIWLKCRKLFSPPSIQVAKGDVIEVDEILEDVGEGSGTKIRRGRVVVEEIGTRTKRGGYHLTLTHYKHYAIFHRNLWTAATHLEAILSLRILDK